MSRLATVVGALSAIVTLADYLAARSFLSHWLHQQIRHDRDGWQVSPTLNLLLIVALVGVVWLSTESPSNDPAARKRLLGLRANLVLLALVGWFVLGPSVATIEEPTASFPMPPSASVNRNPVAAVPASRTPGPARGLPEKSLSHGHTSQFTWQQGGRSSPSVAWRPGDGLRAIAQLLEDVAAPSAAPNR